MKKIGVHDGVFHADDAFAVAALRRLFGEIEVVRTRDAKALAACDLRVDVGGTYDHEGRTYDHHQTGGAGKRKNGIPYAGFGLIWRHYGAEICNGDKEVAKLVEKFLVQAVDAVDCGFSLWVKEKVPGAQPRTISDMILQMNPSWYEDQDFDAAFDRAVDLASTLLEREIARAKGMVLARAFVRKAIAEAVNPRIIVLDRACPWFETVVREAPDALFVIYPAETKGWRIQAVPTQLGSFEKRRALPAAWAGKERAELAALTGVPDVNFCHTGLFIAGAASKEGALALAALALAE